jgi:hypothetical protein
VLRLNPLHDNFKPMSQVLKLPPQELRASLHGRIDELTDDELELAGQQLSLFESKRAFDKLREEMSEDWRTGRITQEKVDEAVRDYRATPLYRTPGRP